ncbi:MAG: hypothetical protein ACRDHY_17220 [Anaerolineales bacterium]
MSDETKPGEDLPPELEVLALRAQLKEAEAREAAALEEVKALKEVLRPRLPGPSQVLHPDDLAAEPLDRRVELNQQVLKGTIRLDPNAPRRRAPVRFVTKREIAGLALDERYKLEMDILAGRARFLEE